MKDTVGFTLFYTPLEAKPRAGGGTYLWVRDPVYLDFDTFPRARSVNWMTGESIGLVESVALELNMASGFQDVVSFVETLDFSMGYHISDTVSFVEDFQPTLQWQREVMGDTIVLQEAVQFHFAPATIAEHVTLVESLGFSYTMRIDETIRLTENFSNGKNQTLSDSFGVTEHGLLLSQSYFDTTAYFTDNYFGEKRTW